MKRFTVVLFAVVLTFAFLSSPSILEAGHGGHGGRGGHHGGFHGSFYFGVGPGFWPGYYGGYYPYYWGAPVVGWPYGGWPYASYTGWPYYPPQATQASPEYNEPEQQQPYYWYYCQDPKGYYPYVKSCPGGWMQVVPNVTPPNQ